ncbi:ricin-type beta-trefoil lectin domain protein [Streptomyces sp. NBC_01341]|uniref:ricin-type beta-trefoil lectin domain protein n=1 Tax=Streptomyces sp. NBC_01341 TaxID=2903831 RepID=UPI002E11BE71|nr:ricin-type beta-trefoil lectin domain protein [Streptomyces sp. NBC_01341]
MTRSAQKAPASSGFRSVPVAEAEEAAVPAASAAGPKPGSAGADTPDAGSETPAVSGPGNTSGEAGDFANKSGETEKSAAAPETPAEGRSGEAVAAQSGIAPGGTAEGHAVQAGTGEPAQRPELSADAHLPESGAETEPETEPDAAAAAKSRLPALVRTMTATAIGQSQQQAGPVGRPGKAVLAGAAVAGALLVSVPFLVLAGNDGDGPGKQSVAAAGTVLDGSGQEAPGEFAVTPPESGSPDEDKQEAGKEGAPEKPVHRVPPSGKDTDDAPPKKAAGSRSEPKSDPKSGPTKPSAEKQSGEKQSDGAKSQPAKAAPAVTFSGPVSFRSHLSGRCIDVPNHDFSDGKALHVWDCNNAPAQKWRFASDGTIRIQDKCLDVANANFSDGTPIQIAWCNGNDAQKFALNGSHDLVNTVVGMCVDIAGANRNSGARLQLLKCSGNDAQKWST